MKDNHSIGVLGAGTWGIALARLLYQNGHDVTVWSALPEEIDMLSSTNRHPNLPGVELPVGINYTKSIEDACKDKEAIIFAVPSVFVRHTASLAREFIAEDQLIVDVAKGIEPDTLMTMTEIIADELKKDDKHDNIRLVALSGPTHAEEVARDIPSAIVSASSDLSAAETVQDMFMNTCMRVYTNDDVLGVELCGAMKNIIALACGISAGLGCGDNTKAALITRGISEVSRLGRAMGANEWTFGGLAGIGDLIVTATSEHSRNNRCGKLIGQGKSPKEAIKEVGMVVEGINALGSAMQLSKKYNVELPIISAVDYVVNHGGNPKEAIGMLMSRDKKAEVFVEFN